MGPVGEPPNDLVVVLIIGIVVKVADPQAAALDHDTTPLALY
jgi:hypothetical protein